MEPKKSLLVIVGPTASGKSELAVKLAKKIDGEIISADSRQVYKGMDIGSGKVPGKWHKKVYLYKAVPHYLIDVASPKRQFSVAQFQTQATKIIDDIFRRGKTPIICGGTGHWVDAVVFGQSLPQVKANPTLRRKLEKMTVEDLFKQLQKLDPDRAAEIDSKNPRRLIRALEIVMSTGKPVPKMKTESKYSVYWIGLNPGMPKLEQKISKRLKIRLKQGLVAEVKKLHVQGLSWKRLESFGLEYKYAALFLQGKLTKQEMEQQLNTAIRQYAKRQMTWWKRNDKIEWLSNAKAAPILQ